MKPARQTVLYEHAPLPRFPRNPISLPDAGETPLGVETGKIYHESCTVTMARMLHQSIDLVITSPPYDNMRSYNGNNFIQFQAVAQSLWMVLKKGGVVVWVVGDETKKGDESGTSFRQALYFKEVGFNLFDTMIYAKPPRGAVGNNKAYWQSFEYMFVFSKGQPKTINLIEDRHNKESRNGDTGSKRLHNGSLLSVRRGGYAAQGRRTNIWEYRIGKGHSASDEFAHKHPAIFPEALARDHILSWSKRGEIVYDPFAGSGTTAKMCVRTGRHFIGSEINQEYCVVACKRIKAAQ